MSKRSDYYSFYAPDGGERVTRASKRAIMRAARDAVKGKPGKWVNVYTPAGRFLDYVLESADVDGSMDKKD